jgi:hypothetical protein
MFNNTVRKKSAHDDSSSFDIVESEYVKQIALSATNVKEERIK